jgi:hypothetical protein
MSSRQPRGTYIRRDRSLVVFVGTSNSFGLPQVPVIQVFSIA